MTGMSKDDRNALIRIVKARAKQSEREADSRAKILLSEIEDLMAAEYEARDALWDDSVAIAEEAKIKANEQIRARCAEFGVPARHAPQLNLSFQSRSLSFADRGRRAELKNPAEARLDALTTTAKAEIQRRALDVEEQLLVSGLETSEARMVIQAMPTVEQLMPSLSLDDLGVKRWQPPKGIAAQFVTPMSPADRIKRENPPRAGDQARRE